MGSRKFSASKRGSRNKIVVEKGVMKIFCPLFSERGSRIFFTKFRSNQRGHENIFSVFLVLFFYWSSAVDTMTSQTCPGACDIVVWLIYMGKRLKRDFRDAETTACEHQNGGARKKCSNAAERFTLSSPKPLRILIWVSSRGAVQYHLYE